MNWPIRNAEFEAEITIFPLGPKTRSTPARNGIRWAFAYAEDVDAGDLTQSDIWPEFVDAHGQRIADHIPLSGVLNARMHMVSLNWSSPYTKRIAVGIKFYMMEGPRPVASGVVTSLFQAEQVR